MSSQSFIFVAIFLIFVSGIITMSFGAPTAELARSASIGVTADDTSLVKFTPNQQYDFVKLTNKGNITASPQNLGADSLNKEMTLQIGDATAPSNNYAFKIENTKSIAVQYNLSLKQQTSYTGTVEDVQFAVQKNSETTNTIYANNTKQSYIVQPSDVLYVSIYINSTGQQTGNLDTTLIVDAKTN